MHGQPSTPFQYRLLVTRFGRFERAITATVGIVLGTLLAILIGFASGANIYDVFILCTFVNLIFLTGVYVGIYFDPGSESPNQTRIYAQPDVPCPDSHRRISPPVHSRPETSFLPANIPMRPQAPASVQSEPPTGLV